MKVTFALPFVSLTGGVRVMLQFAEAMQAGGHDVCVVYPTWPYRFHFGRRAQLQTFIRTVQQPAAVPWMELSCRVNRVPLIANAFVTDADLIVATSWPVIHDVARLSTSKGTKIHILFHHESGTGPEEAVVETYRLPFRRLVFAERVRDQLRSDFGCTTHHLVSAGIDTRRFFAEGPRRPCTAFMIYHPDPRKGGDDGIRALVAAKAAVPDLQATLAGTVPPRTLPSWMTFVRHPPDDVLRRLYSTAAVFLYPSRYEGFGLPPLEAMACGCPVVTTAVGAIGEYADASNARVVPSGDVDAMTAALIELLRDDDARRQLAANGLRTAARYEIDVMSRHFVKTLEAAAVH